MKYCFNCGTPMEDHFNICSKCGTILNQTQQSANFGYQNAGYNGDNNPQRYYPQPQTDDASSKGLSVLGFFLPIVGLILYFVWKDEKPLKAESTLIGTLLSFGISVPVVGIILYFVWKGEKPSLAKASLTGAIIGFALYVISIIIGVILSVISAGLSIYSYGSAFGSLINSL